MKKLLFAIAAAFISISGVSQIFTPPSYASIDTNYRTYENQLVGNDRPNLFIKNLSVENQ